MRVRVRLRLLHRLLRKERNDGLKGNSKFTKMVAFWCGPKVSTRIPNALFTTILSEWNCSTYKISRSSELGSDWYGWLWSPIIGCMTSLMRRRFLRRVDGRSGWVIEDGVSFRRRASPKPLHSCTTSVPLYCIMQTSCIERSQVPSEIAQALGSKTIIINQSIKIIWIYGSELQNIGISDFFFVSFSYLVTHRHDATL